MLELLFMLLLFALFKKLLYCQLLFLEGGSKCAPPLTTPAFFTDGYIRGEVIEFILCFDAYLS